MYCPQCGKQAKDGALFCPACGTGLGGGPSRAAAPAPSPDPQPLAYAARRPAARTWFTSAVADSGLVLVLAAAGYWVWAHPVPNLRTGSTVQSIEKAAPAAPPAAGASAAAPAVPLAPQAAPAPAEDAEVAAAQAALDKAIAEEQRMAKERK